MKMTVNSFPPGFLKRFSKHGMTISYQARRGRKSFLMYLIDKALAPNPQMSFAELIDMAICNLFRDNPDCNKLFEADTIRFHPDFTAVRKATFTEMKNEIEKHKND